MAKKTVPDLIAELGRVAASKPAKADAHDARVARLGREIVELGGEEGARQLIAAMWAADREHRDAFLNALVGGGDVAKDVAIAAALDAQQARRRRLLQGLARFPGQDSRIRALFEAELQHEPDADLGVALATFGDPRLVEPIVEAFRRYPLRAHAVDLPTFMALGGLVVAVEALGAKLGPDEARKWATAQALFRRQARDMREAWRDDDDLGEDDPERDDEG